jgi:integrase/recombinase XerD
MTSLTDRWAASMSFGGAAENTVTTRARALRRLEKDRGDLLTLTRTDLLDWLAVYKHPSTRSTMLSYVRVFYAWCVDEGLLIESPALRLGKVKVPNGAPRPAEESDVVAMLRTAPPRTRMMAQLMVYGGLRCCEVARARPDHVVRRSDRWWLDIPHSKGGHHQAVPLPGWLAEEFRVFLSWDVSPQTVQRDVRRALKAAGSSATPHQLRHYYGTTALRQTQNLAKVQKMMRHASPATTARYTLVTGDELADVAEGLPRIA